MSVLRAAGLGACTPFIGRPTPGTRCASSATPRPCCARSASICSAPGRKPVPHAALRDNPECAQQEYDRILDAGDAGLVGALSFDPAEDIAAPFINAVRAQGGDPARAGRQWPRRNGGGLRPRRLCRGRRAHERHPRRPRFARRLQGRVACGGFSYGDVLGAGRAGRAPSSSTRARATSSRPSSAARHLRAGRLQRLPDDERAEVMIPGADAWPRFERNRSSSSRRASPWSKCPSPSMFFAGMAGSRMPVVVSHGEGPRRIRLAEQQAQRAGGHALPRQRRQAERGLSLQPERFARRHYRRDHADGRFTIMMPHPERVFRSVQMSWHPDNLGEDSPWMRMFRNLRLLGQFFELGTFLQVVDDRFGVDLRFRPECGVPCTRCAHLGLDRGRIRP
jgi:phosphoribosylformylglycinamidine synthase